MEFRLLYQGELESAGNRAKVDEKHAIRRSFHPQLRRLWTMRSNLRQFAEYHGSQLPEIYDQEIVAKQGWFNLGLKAIGKKWNRAGYDFVPLVTAEQKLRCSLDILLLRPEDDRFIFTQGDLDGQVKTLFDALKMPQQIQDVSVGPQNDESPFFCLLEDDRLISEVRVVSDQLLLLPDKPEAGPNDAFAVIHVNISHRTPGTFDQWFG